MAYYLITSFAGTSLQTGVIEPVGMSESRAVISRIGILDNGAKFDADGTAAADVALGQVVGRFLILSDTAGMTAFNNHVRTLEAMAGVRGTLTGLQDATPDVTYTCTARCVSTSGEEYSVSNGTPLRYDKRQVGYINVVWEKLTEWA